jgi:hypothetical protein
MNGTRAAFICRRRHHPTGGFAMERNKIGMALVLCLAGGASCCPPLPPRSDRGAAQVRRRQGRTSIQAKPCAKGTTEVWARPAQTEPKPSAADLAAAREREARAQKEVIVQSEELQRRLQPQVAPAPPERPVPGSHLAGATNPPEGSQMAPLPVEEPQMPQAVTVDNCQAAQAFAGSVREKTWIGLTDDQLKRIFGWVSDQCRVRTQSSNDGLAAAD